MFVIPVIPPKPVHAALPAAVSLGEMSVPFVLALVAALGGNAYMSGNLEPNKILTPAEFGIVQTDLLTYINANKANKDAFFALQDSYLANARTYAINGATGAFNGIVTGVSLAGAGLLTVNKSLNNLLHRDINPKAVNSATAAALSNLKLQYRYTIGNYIYYSSGDKNLNGYSVATSGYSLDPSSANFNIVLSTATIKNLLLVGSQVWYICPVDQSSTTLDTSRKLATMNVYMNSDHNLVYGMLAAYGYAYSTASIGNFAIQYGYDLKDMYGNPLGIVNPIVDPATLDVPITETSATGEIDIAPVLPYIPENTTIYNISNPSYITNTYTTATGAIPFTGVPAVTIDVPAGAVPNTGSDTWIGVITGAITGVITGINTGIETATGAITGAIDGVITGIESVTAAIIDIPIAINDFFTVPLGLTWTDPLVVPLTAKIPIIGQLPIGLGQMFSGDTRPLIINYNYNGARQINLDWYEPMRLQVRGALGLIFQILCGLTIFKMVSSLFGMGNLGRGARAMASE